MRLVLTIMLAVVLAALLFELKTWRLHSGGDITRFYRRHQQWVLGAGCVMFFLMTWVAIDTHRPFVTVVGLLFYLYFAFNFVKPIDPWSITPKRIPSRH